MGEYATHNGRTIKIGTCENMYGLTAEQAPLVVKAPNSLDPIRYAEQIRFRFPFPDEDGRAPGQPDDFERRVKIPGTTAPEGVNHYRREGSCEGAEVAVAQQKVVDGALALVCACANCGALYRLPTLLDAAETIGAIFAAAGTAYEADEHDRADFLLSIARRAIEGYATPPAWVAARKPKAAAA